MILYAVHYFGELSNNTASIVTIHKTRESAEEYKNQYIRNISENDIENIRYTIDEINTDVDNDVIYDYENFS